MAWRQKTGNVYDHANVKRNPEMAMGRRLAANRKHQKLKMECWGYSVTVTEAKKKAPVRLETRRDLLTPHMMPKT